MTRLASACAVLSAAWASSPFCGTAPNGGLPPMASVALSVYCSVPGDTIASVDAAFYGTPSGDCGSLEAGSCNAANATSIVKSACLGQGSCTIWPNSTTFGDPCFGTVKWLVVQMSCGNGGGVAQAVYPGGNPPPAYSASVTADFSKPVGTTVKAVSSIQVVAHHTLLRSAPQHDAAFAAVQALAPQHARFAPWFPYPKMAVAALEPPSGNMLCSPAATVGGQIEPFTFDCGPMGGSITSVQFASFGTPTGICGSFAVDPTCHNANSSAVAAAQCVGRQSCQLGPQDFTGANCPASATPYLAAQFACSNSSAQFTYWNFTLLDNFLLDFWNAVDGDASAPIISFSTAPTWLYDNATYAYPDDPAVPFYGYNRGVAPAPSLEALGDYYGRVLAWYTRGGFTDENGVYHASGHYLNITLHEIFNEVDYEHGHTPQSYTVEFDAIVRGIRKAADPGHQMKFVGLSLPNIDDQDKVVAWATYFLNISNHAPDVTDALDYIGYHSYPTNGGYTPDPTTFTRMFDYVDSFLQKVQAVDAVIASLSPTTLTYLDESGTDMDNVLGKLQPPYDNPRYWVASGAYFAYLFATVASGNNSVRSVGQSQLMDAPGQEPSVTMLSWTDGAPTARYWVNWLLKQHFSLGDAFVASSSSSPSLYVAAFSHGQGTGASRKLLLINKINAVASVDISSLFTTSCSAVVVDETVASAAPAASSCAGGSIDLLPYSTAVITVA